MPLLMRWACLLCLAFGLAAGLLGRAHADELQAVPALSGRVVDTAQGLTAAQARELDGLMAQVERNRGAQMAVLIVRTTAPEDIAAYANRVANTWKIGQRDVGDGLLIIVALDDRTVRIEVAKALEGDVPDVLAGRIIQQDMVPAFRRGDRAGGLRQAIVRLSQALHADVQAPGVARAASDAGVAP